MKDKKPLTLEKKEHETLTLGKKATRAWKKGRKKRFERFSQRFCKILSAATQNIRFLSTFRSTAFSAHSVVFLFQNHQHIP